MEPTSSARRSSIAFSNALCKEISYYAPTHGRQETVEAIHVGGRPALIGADGIRAVVGSLFSNFDVVGAGEISIDLAPSTFDLAALQGFIALGFNTINIDAASFFPDDLKALDLHYTPEAAVKLIDESRQAGFDNLSLTLNIGIPDQPIEYWAANLEKALGLGIGHISLKGMPVYNLQTTPDQLAACFSYPAPNPEQLEKYAFTSSYLSGAGLEHYALSAFARPGYRSRQRELQLLHGNILGIGPAAHSFWWLSGSRSRANRWSNVENIEHYRALIDQKELPVETHAVLDLDALADEYMLLRIQHADGLDLLRMEAEYGLDLLTDRIEQLAWLESEGYIEPIRNNRVRLSDYGRTHSLDAFSRLLDLTGNS